MIEKLAQIYIRFEDVGEKLTLPDVVSDQEKYRDLSKQYKELEPIVTAYKEYKLIIENLANSKALLKEETDPEMREMAKMEIDDLEGVRPEIEEEIRFMLIPKDPEDEKRAIMEFRAGTGGDEACIFVEDIFRMFTMFFLD